MKNLLLAATAFTALSVGVAQAAPIFVANISPVGSGNASSPIANIPAPSGTDTYYWIGTAEVPGQLSFTMNATNGSFVTADFEVYSDASFTNLIASGTGNGTAMAGPITAVGTFYVVTTTAPESGTTYGGTVGWNVAPVPEPATMTLLGAGLLGLGMARRRRG